MAQTALSKVSTTDWNSQLHSIWIKEHIDLNPIFDDACTPHNTGGYSCRRTCSIVDGIDKKKEKKK